MQNKNECIHSKVWMKCPKTGFIGLLRVIAAVCASVAEFNEAIEGTITCTFRLMDIASGTRRKASALKADQMHLKKSLHQAKDSSKWASQARKTMTVCHRQY